MTVTFAVPSGQPLASRHAPITFTASGEVVAVSVGLGELGEERAFRDGAFTERYAESRRTGSVYTLRRRDGWPVAPTVYVDEAAAGAVPWGSLHEIDFTAEAAQEIGTGAYTIGGLQWWAKGTKALAHKWTRVVPGVGLQFRVEGGLGYQPTGDLPGNGWNTQVLFAPLSQVAGYNAAAPVALQFRLSASDGWPAAALASVACGFLGTEENGAAVRAVDRPSQQWFGCHGATEDAAFAGGTGYTTVPAQPSDAALDNGSFTIVRATQRVAATFHLKGWTGSFPDVAAPAGAAGVTGLVASGDATNLGIGVLLNSQNHWTLNLTKLRIVQPRNA